MPNPSTPQFPFLHEVTMSAPNVVRLEFRDGKIQRGSFVEFATPVATGPSEGNFADPTNNNIATPGTVVSLDGKKVKFGDALNLKTFFNRTAAKNKAAWSFEGKTILYLFFANEEQEACNWHQLPSAPSSVFHSVQLRHYIYLVLNSNLQSRGGPYWIGFPPLVAAQVGVSGYSFEFDDRKTRANIIKTPYVGHRPNDDMKLSYLREKVLGYNTPSGEGMINLPTDYGITTFEILNKAGTLVYSGPIRLAPTPLTVSSPVGTFGVGNTVVGSLSGATAKVTRYDTGKLTVKNITGTFQVGETVTDAVASASAIITVIGKSASRPDAPEVIGQPWSSHPEFQQNLMRNASSTLPPLDVLNVAGNTCTVAAGQISQISVGEILMFGEMNYTGELSEKICKVSGISGNTFTFQYWNYSDAWFNPFISGYPNNPFGLIGDAVGKVYKTYASNAAASWVHWLDYSDFNPDLPGDFYIRIPGVGISDLLPIDHDVYLRLAKVAAAGEYHQRNGAGMDGRFGYSRPVAFRHGVNGCTLYRSKVMGEISTQGVGGLFEPGIYGYRYKPVIETDNWRSWVTTDPVDGGGGVRDAGDWDSFNAGYSYTGEMQLLNDINPACLNGSAGFNPHIPTISEALGPPVGNLWTEIDNAPDIIHQLAWQVALPMNGMSVDGGSGHGMQGNGQEGMHREISSDALGQWYTYFETHISTYLLVGALAALAQILYSRGYTTVPNMLMDAAERGFAFSEDILVRHRGHVLITSAMAGMFPIGATITGVTSGTTAKIIGPNNPYAVPITTGNKLYLKNNITGPGFTVGEAITCAPGTGTATVVSYTLNTQPVLVMSGIVGVFRHGETITGGTSGTKAKLWTNMDSATLGAGPYIAWKPSGNFTVGETITGAKSGAHGTFVSLTTTNIQDLNYYYVNKGELKLNIPFTGTVTKGSSVITNIPDTSILRLRMELRGDAVQMQTNSYAYPERTCIKSIDSPTQITTEHGNSGYYRNGTPSYHADLPGLSRINLTSVTGAFKQFETVTGQSSGTTMRVNSFTPGTSFHGVYLSGSVFSANEIIKGEPVSYGYVAQDAHAGGRCFLNLFAGSGTFYVGETLTGESSGTVAVIEKVQTANTFFARYTSGSAFSNGERVHGDPQASGTYANETLVSTGVALTACHPAGGWPDDIYDDYMGQMDNFTATYFRWHTLTGMARALGHNSFGDTYRTIYEAGIPEIGSGGHHTYAMDPFANNTAYANGIKGFGLDMDHAMAIEGATPYRVWTGGAALQGVVHYYGYMFSFLMPQVSCHAYYPGHATLPRRRANLQSSIGFVHGANDYGMSGLVGFGRDWYISTHRDAQYSGQDTPLGMMGFGSTWTRYGGGGGQWDRFNGSNFSTINVIDQVNGVMKSSSSVTVGTGNKTFTIGPTNWINWGDFNQINPGLYCYVEDQTTGNWMRGTTGAWDRTNRILTINVTEADSVGGTGNNWQFWNDEHIHWKMLEPYQNMWSCWHAINDHSNINEMEGSPVSHWRQEWMALFLHGYDGNTNNTPSPKRVRMRVKVAVVVGSSRPMSLLTQSPVFSPPTMTRKGAATAANFVTGGPALLAATLSLAGSGPGAVTNVVVSANSTTALNVTFTAANGAVSHQERHCRFNRATWSAPATVTNLVSNLPVGTQMHVQIRGVDNVGTPGAWSTAAQATTTAAVRNAGLGTNVSSGDAYIDSLLQDSKYTWSAGQPKVLTFSFPQVAASYVGALGGAYGSSEQLNNFHGFTTTQQAAVRLALMMWQNVCGIQFQEVAGDGTTAANEANIRFAFTDATTTAWSYYPASSPEGSDSWFNFSSGLFSNFQVGNYAWKALLHEIGHTLGFKHPHQAAFGSPFGTMPLDKDCGEFTVMSYNSFFGAGWAPYTNETWSYPQTPMQLDIAVARYAYGPDTTGYCTGDTMHQWSATTGAYSINNVLQYQPGANRVFMTVCDAGGVDTYNFSNYIQPTVSLALGGYSWISTGQLANLGGGPNNGLARGNVFNSTFVGSTIESFT